MKIQNTAAYRCVLYVDFGRYQSRCDELCRNVLKQLNQIKIFPKYAIFLLQWLF